MRRLKSTAEKEEESPEQDELGPEQDEMEEAEDESIGDWILTYADMVTLLLCFFVLLFAMSSVQQESFEQLVQSLKQAIGKQNIPKAGTREGLTMQDIPAETQPHAVDELGGMIEKELDTIVSKVRELIMFNKLQGKVRVEKNELGAIITLSDIVLFPTGKAKMTSEGLEVMLQICEILKQFSYHIKILGHTDNVPIHTEKFASNWELSANRACEVVRFLINQGYDPELLSAEGYAKYRPIASNDTAEGRQKNRRVEIVYERRHIEKALGGNSETQKSNEAQVKEDNGAEVGK